MTSLSLFGWVWDLLYGISKSMYAIIDNMLSIANMLVGIEPIKYQGAEMDFLTFLMRNQAIMYAFVGSVGIGIFLVFIFGIFAIIRTIASEKIEKTPHQIAISVGKTLLIFLFIPLAMATLIYLGNALMRILYQTTLGGSTKGLGSFLAGAFGQNARKGGVSPDFYLDPNFNYSSTGNMKKYVDLSDYDYFFSWLSSVVIIICIAQILLMFVDRAISIVILFIFSPISLSTSIIDDGARFKLWRDQFLVKFLTGYGCILALNIYALIIAAINQNGLQFFNDTTLNNLMKIAIIIGGGVSMFRIMALVGNLISAGAGSNELRDNAIATAGFKSAIAGAATAPFKATRGAVNFIRDSANNGLGTTIGRNLGFRTSRDYAIEQGRVSRGQQSSGGNANNKAGAGAGGLGNNGNAAKNAISGGANPGGVSRIIGGGANNPGGNGGGANNANKNPGGNQIVGNAVNNALNNAGKKGDKK